MGQGMKAMPFSNAAYMIDVLESMELNVVVVI